MVDLQESQQERLLGNCNAAACRTTTQDGYYLLILVLLVPNYPLASPIGIGYSKRYAHTMRPSPTVAHPAMAAVAASAVSNCTRANGGVVCTCIDCTRP